MTNANDQMDNLTASISAKHAPGFSLVIAFQYYDGPEFGLSVYPNGTGLRFTSVGDAKSRMFRAFKFELVGDGWWRRIERLPGYRRPVSGMRIDVPSEETKEIIILDDEVASATSTDLFLGLGSPAFEWLAVASASQKNLDKADCAGFSYVHGFLKKRK